MKPLHNMALASLCLLAVPALAQQQTVVVRGNTNADTELQKDILANIFLYSKAADQCEEMGEVNPKVLKGYEPQDPAYRVGEGKVTYERWDVMLCGKRKTFLISFWPADGGGSLFSIGFPPPSDMPE